MRSLRLGLTLWAFLALLSLVAGSLQSHEDAIEAFFGRIVARQDEEPTQTEDSEATETADSSETEEATGSETESASDSEETGTKTTNSKKPTPTSIDPRLGAGGIQMVTPGPHAQDTYIKIGDWATFAWNYTSLEVTPSAVDVVAYCSRNDHTYTIAGNQSVEETGRVLWDTRAHATGDAPLLTETYTFQVYDVESGPSDVASAGHLGSLSQHTFGMYEPQKYTPLNEFKCATCSAAVSDMERQALLVMVGMSTITIASFTWFASGFGLF